MRSRPSRTRIFVFAFVALQVAALLTSTAVGTAILCGLGVAMAFVPVRSVVGRMPTSRELVTAVVLVPPLIAVSLGTTYLVYWPLSFFLPTFVETWVLESPPDWVAYASDPSARNLAVGTCVVLAYVALEEFLFRGLLLRGLVRRWGVRMAVVISSGVFGAGHPDVLGATFFGFVMAVLYVRTQSLLVPIVVHAANNLVAFGLLVIDPSAFTVADFQSYGWLGLLGVLALPWACRFAVVHWTGLRSFLAPGMTPMAECSCATSAQWGSSMLHPQE